MGQSLYFTSKKLSIAFSDNFFFFFRLDLLPQISYYCGKDRSTAEGVRPAEWSGSGSADSLVLWNVMEQKPPLFLRLFLLKLSVIILGLWKREF